MEKFQGKYRIPSARLASWDYGANGIYFVTVNTAKREPFLGNVGLNNEGSPEFSPTEIGKIVQSFWYEIPSHFSFVRLDSFTLMPDHLHGIICFEKEVEREWQAGKPGAQFDTLGVVLGSFKSAVTKQARTIDPSFSWQTRFWDSILRDDESLHRVRTYIDLNVQRWWEKYCRDAGTAASHSIAGTAASHSIAGTAASNADAAHPINNPQFNT